MNDAKVDGTGAGGTPPTRVISDDAAMTGPAAWALWSSLAILATWSMLRSCGADEVQALARPLVPAFAFTPYAALISPLPPLYAAVRRRWGAFIVGVAVAGLFMSIVLPRAAGAPGPPAHGPLLRVLTANMRFGRADPQVLVGLTRRLHVDVLCLEEYTARSGTALTRAGLLTLLPYRVADPVGGALGTALFARHPLRALPMPRLSVVGLALPRAVVRLPTGRRVEVMAVHLAKPLSARGLAEWTRGLAAVPRAGPNTPVRLVAGDFNSTVDDARLRRRIRQGYTDAAGAAGSGLVPTFHQWPWPPITIDHVLVDLRCAVRRVSVFDLPRSDHRAVFAEIRLPA